MWEVDLVRVDLMGVDFVGVDLVGGHHVSIVPIRYMQLIVVAFY